MAQFLFGRIFSPFELLGFFVAWQIPGFLLSTLVFVAWMTLSWLLCKWFDVEY